MVSLRKFCVFCGKNPVSKNKEHILPKWLIELTGDKNRNTTVLIDKNDFSPIQHSFSAFTFPACEGCNSDFSFLENEAKRILLKFFQDEPVTEEEISLFLDWMDKVRVGLWLADIVRNSKQNSVDPNFYISDRVGQGDRAIHILRCGDGSEGLGYTGVSTLAFHLSPSCFALSINSLSFINISSQNLFSHNLQFPIFKNRYLKEFTGLVGGDFSRARSKVSLPIMPPLIGLDCLSLFQPVISSELANEPKYLNLFQTGFLEKNILSCGRRGRIYLRSGNCFEDVRGHPKKLGTSLLAPYDRETVSAWLGYNVLKLQLKLIAMSPRYDHFSDENREYVESQIKYSKKINGLVMNDLRKKLKIVGVKVL
ncbi:MULTISPECIES: hypothetical protein [unclassified Thalassospira]|uniref:hypothetical protein n=1 Tax=unclassified Thalassospira TaxID=2648997 RepID=UPI001B230646|nr:hypothetical protein [Thalassospira sp.]MBO6772729.1 hypothetical protein [Thalassospira sp.]